MQKMLPNIVPAMEGWRPTRQVDNQTKVRHARRQSSGDQNRPVVDPPLPSPLMSSRGLTREGSTNSVSHGRRKTTVELVLVSMSVKKCLLLYSLTWERPDRSTYEVGLRCPEALSKHKSKNAANTVPAGEGWRASRQVDNQTFFDRQQVSVHQAADMLFLLVVVVGPFAYVCKPGRRHICNHKQISTNVINNA